MLCLLIHWKETNALCGYRSFLPGQQAISCLVVKYNIEYMRFEYYIKSFLTKKNMNNSNLFVLTKDSQSRHDVLRPRHGIVEYIIFSG